MGLPREVRRYLGKWAAEPTADQYVRDHRHIISQAWTLIANHHDDT